MDADDDRVDNPRVPEPRLAGGEISDKLHRAGTELREAAEEIRETANSVEEAGERIKTLEASIRLRWQQIQIQMGKQEQKLAALAARISAMEPKP